MWLRWSSVRSAKVELQDRKRAQKDNAFRDSPQLPSSRYPRFVADSLLRKRSDAGTSHAAGQWRKLSPSAELMVVLTAARGVRSEILGRPGPDRYPLQCSTRLTQWRRGGAGELGEAHAEGALLA